LPERTSGIRPGIRVDSMQRSTVLAALGVLLAGALVWLLVRGDAAPIDIGGPLVRPGANESAAGERTEGTPDAVLSGRGDPREAERAGPPPGPRRGDVAVRALGTGGVPLAGQWVTVFEAGQAVAHHATGSDGRVRLAAVSFEGGVSVALGHHRAAPAGSVVIRGPEVLLTALEVITLRLDLRDAETGADLPNARWSLAPAEGMPPPTVVATGETLAVRYRPGATERIAFRVEAPRGFVAWDDPQWSVAVSRYATRLVAQHPLRRESQVTLSVTEAGEPAAGATVHWFSVGGRAETSPRMGVFVLGGFALLGVPFFRGEELRFALETTSGAVAEGRVALPPEPHAALTYDVEALPLENGREAPKPEPALPGPPAPLPSSGFGEAPGATGGAEGLFGALRVTALRRDGTPAAAARLFLPASAEQRADADGRLEFAGIPSREHRVLLAEPGLVPTSSDAFVPAGGTVEIVLQEQDGGTVFVRVVDGRGRPLPFARLSLRTPSGIPWVDLRDGEQRLDLHTDQRGERTLEHVEPGTLALGAVWAGREGRAEVTVADRSTVEAQIVVP
jgi:hypothetical protein